MIANWFALILILNATDLFRFVAPQLGVEIGTVSAVLLVINLGYLFCNWPTLMIVLRDRQAQAWCLIFGIIPAFASSYSVTFSVREIGLHGLCCTLFLSAIVFAITRGMQACRHVLLLSFCLGIFGCVLSFLSPGYFNAVADLAGANLEVGERAFGFFLQPNSAAGGLLYLYIGLCGFFVAKTRSPHYVFLVAFLVLGLMTGSRMVIAIAGIIVGLSFLGRGAIGQRKGTQITQAILIGVSLAVAVSFVNWLTRDSDSGLAKRVRMVSSLQLTSASSIRDDISLQGRLVAQQRFVRLIAERPLMGYGTGADLFLRDQGVLPASAHSEALSRGLEFGVLYVLLLMSMVWRLFRTASRRTLETMSFSPFIMQFCVAFGVLFVANHVSLNVRAFYVVLGFVFAATRFLPNTLVTHLRRE